LNYFQLNDSTSSRLFVLLAILRISVLFICISGKCFLILCICEREMILIGNNTMNMNLKTVRLYFFALGSVRQLWCQQPWSRPYTKIWSLQWKQVIIVNEKQWMYKELFDIWLTVICKNYLVNSVLFIFPEF
jgi:hypothetical protein